MSNENLQNILTNLLRCDSEYCSNVTSLVTDGVICLSEIEQPDEFAVFTRCMKDPSDKSVCENILTGMLNKVTPHFLTLLDKARVEKDKDSKYVGVNPLRYTSPFWYSSIGDIWRRGRNLKVEEIEQECQVLKEEARTCAVDGAYTNSQCLLVYRYSRICALGAKKPEVMLPLLQCISRFQLEEDDKFQQCYDDLLHGPKELPMYKQLEKE